MASSQTHFANARDFTVKGGHFFNISHTNINNVSEIDQVSTTLWQHVAAGAMFDSAERFPPAKCHPGTRERMIEKIVDWIENPAPNQRILWLYGPAGSGKSALAHTICERYKERCKASFFFARGPTDRGKALKLFPTLSYQLALQFPSMRTALNEALYHDPSLPTKSMEAQLSSLIIQPLLRFTPSQDHGPILIIDGLDECGDDQGMDTQRNIIELISKSIAEHDIPLLFLIASRPDSWIRDTFESSPPANITLSLSLRDDIDADNDIRAYLTAEFEKIRVENKRIMGSVTAPWPPSYIVDRFVYEASGQYIYASTVLKFVGKSSRYSDPLKQLRILTSPGPHRVIAFSELYRLYETIISAYPRWETMKRVLGGILADADATVIEHILGVDSTELTLVLDALSALIDVEMPRPLSNYEQMLEPIYGSLNMGTAKITLCHLSLREFLEDETHSGLFHVDVQDIIQDLAREFFGIIIRNIDQNYATEPHFLLNIGLTTYQNMMSRVVYCVGGQHQGTDIDTLCPSIIATMRNLFLFDPDLELEYFGCFMTDIHRLYHIAGEIMEQAIHSECEEEKVDDCVRIMLELQDAASLARQRCTHLLSSYKKFRVTPTLAHLHEFHTSQWFGIPVDGIFHIGHTVADVLSTFQQHRHIITVFFDPYRRKWTLENVNLNDGLIEDPVVDRDEYEGWRTRGQWRHERISLMSQYLNKTLNTVYDQWEPHWHLSDAASFFQSRNLSDICTTEYFEDPCNLSILSLMANLSAQAYLSASQRPEWHKLQYFLFSVLCWFNRQLVNSTSLNLLKLYDQNLVPKMRATMKEIFENFFLPSYRRSYHSGLSVSVNRNDGNKSIKIKVFPLPQGWSQEDIPYIPFDCLHSLHWRGFHDEVFGKTLLTEECPPTIDPFRWHPYLASHLLNSLAKDLYRRINPTFEFHMDGHLGEQTSETFAYIVECLPYAETTQQNLDSLRAIAYLFPDANLDWDLPIEFWYLCVEFLRKYDRSILSAEELNEFEWWMYSMGRWMKRYHPATAT